MWKVRRSRGYGREITGIAEDLRHAGNDALHGGSGAKQSEA